MNGERSCGPDGPPPGWRRQRCPEHTVGARLSSQLSRTAATEPFNGAAPSPHNSLFSTDPPFLIALSRSLVGVFEEEEEISDAGMTAYAARRRRRPGYLERRCGEGAKKAGMTGERRRQFRGERWTRSSARSRPSFHIYHIFLRAGGCNNRPSTPIFASLLLSSRRIPHGCIADSEIDWSLL
ncbi:hypothetical protein PtA15_1A606 [Puccinia triticina]|uniref:Uncharacterized protein n=1 Tax=Puccinia triticina TaxID=208348 RepID=A0ABY7CAS6_9BASI|nr:uncharacterized protein PtA15_1A606 [Puccinia triticina]WAQ81266.1 hypothetical protein PtA15_1A606 [Puccinia triticina]WAR52156.1 hypothetical protein PtB15_1B595 [Puccinia triticina]